MLMPTDTNSELDAPESDRPAVKVEVQPIWYGNKAHFQLRALIVAEDFDEAVEPFEQVRLDCSAPGQAMSSCSCRGAIP